MDCDMECNGTVCWLLAGDSEMHPTTVISRPKCQEEKSREKTYFFLKVILMEEAPNKLINVFISQSFDGIKTRTR